MRTLLYMMSAGDLGLDSSSVESSVTHVLKMSPKWNAILLDEADVFLESRCSNDLERNKLVSSPWFPLPSLVQICENIPKPAIRPFSLPSHAGIILQYPLLTTNQVANIDAALLSRIHISIEYAPLSLSSRRHIWSNFLSISSSSGARGLSDSDLDTLGIYELNGGRLRMCSRRQNFWLVREAKIWALSTWRLCCRLNRDMEWCNRRGILTFICGYSSTTVGVSGRAWSS